MKTSFTFLYILALATAASAQTDTTPPTIVCRQDVVAVNIQPTGAISLWADATFYDTLYDNESTPIELGIRKVCMGTGFPDDTLVTYFYTGQFAVELWARDEAGNTASCIAHIMVGDMGNSEPGLLNIIPFTELNDGVEEVDFEVRGYHCYNDSFLYTGICCLSIPEPGSSFTITPSKNDNPLNGVTTYDLVMIAKHIMGIEPLDSPYKLIAADANFDGKITLFDVVLLRRLILGIVQELPHGQSWRFMPYDYVFPNPQHPFEPAFPEIITVPFVTDPYVDTHRFRAVKIGDVNNTAVSNGIAAPLNGH